jgi:uncharacterized glyoxalase superfamily protein PhnB
MATANKGREEASEGSTIKRTGKNTLHCVNFYKEVLNNVHFNQFHLLIAIIKKSNHKTYKQSAMKLKLVLPSYVPLPLAVLAMVTCVFIFKTKSQQIEKLNKANMGKPVIFSTYVFPGGSCKEAMEFYKSCVSEELSLTIVGESPMKGLFRGSMRKKLLYVKLVSGNIHISASDWLCPLEAFVQENTVCLYLSGGQYDEIKNLSDKKF